MTEPDAPDPWAQVRARVLDDAGLVRAVATGRRRGAEAPPWRRVELRWVDLKAGRRLQVVRYDETQAFTANHDAAEAVAEVDALLAVPFGNWHVETAAEVLQVRVSKKGVPLAHVGRRAKTPGDDVERSHDRAKERLIDAADPVWRLLGLTDDAGRVKPSRQAKFRQVERFSRLLDATVTEAMAGGRLRRPTPDAPLRVADLGCGNAYLAVAAHRVLAGVRGLPVELVGVDVKEQSRRHNTDVAEQAGLAGLRFEVGTIDGVGLDPAPEVVLALHACDTATDDALARAVGWDAPVVLAAPCCHHDVAAQLRGTADTSPHPELLRHGILRERLADTLTDTVRALLLRRAGYRVDVVEFVDSEHTPRNTLLRAVRAGRGGRGGVREEAAAEYDALVGAWGLRPRLGELLA